MLPIRAAISRPSIRELKSFLLSPQSQILHCSTPQFNRLLRPQATTTFPRTFSTTPNQRKQISSPSSHKHAPSRSRDRGPASTESTQTDFSVLDVLGDTAAPSTSIDACLSDGFHLDNGIKITDGDGVLLVAGEAFTWKPWDALPGAGNGKGQKSLVNEKGQFEVPDEAWGLLGVVWPKPDLLILGLGGEMRPLSPKTKRYINSLGIRVDVSDTRNAAAMFNLLATERGIDSVAGALIPIG